MADLKHYLAIYDGERIVDRSDRPYVSLAVADEAAKRFTALLHEHGMTKFKFLVIVDPATPLSELE